MRQMALIGFLQAQNCSNLVSSWRHPAARPDFLSAEYYQEIAQILEAGKFHLAFFDDRLAMPDRYGNDHAHTLEHGIRCVKMDPLACLMAMAMGTKQIGLGATYSTTYYEPYHVARVFATVDHLIGGRVAWNVVTSLNDGEAWNMGREQMLAHDLRYDRADEFMEVVLGHWDSWDDDAIVLDKQRMVFAKPGSVRRLDHKGEFFHSRGPFTVPRTPQGRPVIIQAGQSGRGKKFSAQWGELVFVSYANIHIAKRDYAELKGMIAAEGRDPESVRISSTCYTVVGESRAEAQEKYELIESLHRDVDSLSLLSEALNFDFASKGMDDPFTSEELESISGLQAIRDRVISLSGNPNPTVAEFLHHSQRGRMQNPMIGTASDVADQMEEWFTGRACDGFVVVGTNIPEGYRDFVRLVVPELQRRKLFREDYTGKTLRENLGLPKAAINDWRR